MSFFKHYLTQLLAWSILLTATMLIGRGVLFLLDFAPAFTGIILSCCIFLIIVYSEASASYKEE